MGIFKKKAQTEVVLQPNGPTDKEREEAKLRALEASLEFLNKPGAQTKATENAPAATEPAAAAMPPVVKNPVAPAIQPPGSVTNPVQAVKASDEKKTDSAPVPRQPESDTAAKTEETGTPRPIGGRRMDYRTAVVKSGPQSKTLMPTSVSNVPPAPLMPQDVQNKAPQPPVIPAKTIVPRVPSVPSGAAQEPHVPGEKTIVAMIPEPAAQPVQNGGAAAPQSPVSMPQTKPLPRSEEKPVPAGNVATDHKVLIKNPLPTPKKHVPREMDFDIQPVSSKMHFDVVDMSGIDHFDIN